MARLARSPAARRRGGADGERSRCCFVKFNDYQCPSCRATWVAYKDIIAKYEAKYPGVFKFETRDYPLEPGVRHGRRAPERLRSWRRPFAWRASASTGREMETWLFEHQEERVARHDQGGPAEILPGSVATNTKRSTRTSCAKLHEDAQLGNKLGVTGTPTFF